MGPLPAAHAATTLVEQDNGGYNFGPGPYGGVGTSVIMTVTSGDVLVVGTEASAACSVDVGDTLGSSYSLQTTAAGPSYVASIYTTTLSSSGSDQIWLDCNPGGSNIILNLYVYELTGVTLASPAKGTGTGTGTAASTSSVGYAAGSFLVGIVADNLGGPATAGSGFTLSSEASGTGTSGAEYAIAGASSSSSSFPVTLSSSVSWSEVSLAIAPLVVTTTTAVTCQYASIAVGSASLCTATVTGSSPTGTVAWSQVGTGGTVTFSAPTCALSGGHCQVLVKGASAGPVTVQGSYSGDSGNLPSLGTAALPVTAPSLSLYPTSGPTGIVTLLTGSGYSFPSYAYNSCFEASTTTASPCPTGNALVPGTGGSFAGLGRLVSGAAGSGLVVVSDPTTGNVIASAQFTITTPAISLSPTSGAVGTSVTVTGTGFSGGFPIGAFTYNGATPLVQTCTSQVTSAIGGFSCTFIVPSSTGVGTATVTASGADVNLVPADTASMKFGYAAPLPPTTGGTVMPAGSAFTDSNGNAWTAPSGGASGGAFSTYFFAGPMTTVPPPMIEGWAGTYGTYQGQQGWIVTFY